MSDEFECRIPLSQPELKLYVSDMGHHGALIFFAFSMEQAMDKLLARADEMKFSVREKEWARGALEEHAIASETMVSTSGDSVNIFAVYN